MNDVRALFDLSGRTALVTGCRRGIGLAIAETLASAGADVIGASAHLEASGSTVETAVRAAGRRFTGYRVDFADRGAVADFATTVLGEHDRIDILVNNAGTIARHPAEEYPDEAWDRVLTVDLDAQFVLTREVARAMLPRGYGRVVFVASVLSVQGGINVAGYAAAKSGIAGLTRALSNEWVGRGITVNALAPGYVDTDNTEALRGDPQRYQAILDRIPAGRWGVPGDIAGAALFLCAPASDYVSGVLLPVDGGWLAR